MKNPITLSGDISQIVRNALSGNVEESFKKIPGCGSGGG